jgi:hypothetical protein
MNLLLVLFWLIPVQLAISPATDLKTAVDEVRVPSNSVFPPPCINVTSYLQVPPLAYEVVPTDLQQRCCKICKKGKACGDTCISRRYRCHKPKGCACNG